MLLSVLLQAANSLELGKVALALAVGLAVFSAAMGISKIAASTMDNMARQPEVAPDIRMSMIIAAALIEGVALFAIVVLGFILK